MANCEAEFSEQGTSRYNLEKTLLAYFQDFLQELEGDGKTLHACRLESMFFWWKQKAVWSLDGK